MTDLEISRQVRGILARHWIDLGHLVLRTVSGRVYIRGLLATIHGPAAQLEPGQVAEIAGAIESVPAVRGVTLMFENWTQEDARWRPVAARV